LKKKQLDSKIVNLEEWWRTHRLDLVRIDGKIQVVEVRTEETIEREDSPPASRRSAIA
jgi:hypothetical protein